MSQSRARSAPRRRRSAEAPASVAEGDLLARRRHERDVPAAGEGNGFGQWVLGVGLAAIVLAWPTNGISFALSPVAVLLSQIERRRARKGGRPPSELSELGRKYGFAVLLLAYLPVVVLATIGFLVHMADL